jgi:hypothetical protein
MSMDPGGSSATLGFGSTALKAMLARSPALVAKFSERFFTSTSARSLAWMAAVSAARSILYCLAVAAAVATWRVADAAPAESTYLFAGLVRLFEAASCRLLRPLCSTSDRTAFTKTPPS